jgi:probable HAF family extracellular repeat protein
MKQLPAIAQTFILTSFSALSLLAVPAQAASFRGLDFFDSSNQYGFSYASAVSADASVVVGSSYNANGYDEAFRWTQESGMVGLGFLGGGVNWIYNYIAGRGVSADGSVVVGESINSNNYSEAFRWTQKSGMVGLGFLGSNNFYSSALGVSGDGSIIVGSSISNDNTDSEAFRWTQESGMVGLGFLPVSSCVPLDSSCPYYPSRSRAQGISADGSVVVGESSMGSRYVPVLWTHQGEIRALDEGGFHDGIANGVSANGSVIVGMINYKAFRWTQSSGMVLLEDHANSDQWSRANGVSADGSIIVGSSNVVHGTSAPSEAFLWTQERGMVSLKDTLIGAGLDLSGWSLDSAWGVSADGFTIVGYGINPSGQNEGWIANLSPEPVPEPLTILGSIAAIAFAASFERKFSKNKSEKKDPDA